MPAPMPMVGIESCAGDPRRDRRGHRLEHEREAAGGLERTCVGEQRERLLGAAALRLVAAEHRRRLGRQADVAHHRDPGADDRPDAREHRARTLQLDRVGSGLLDEADGISQRILVRHLEGAEGQVRDHERPARPARDGAGQDQHLLDGRGDGRLVSEHRHRRGVADEHEVGAGLVGQAAARRVVRRDHDHRLAPRLHLGELGEGKLPRRRSGRRGSLRSGAHEASPSMTTLSIKRVEPTRTAPARTGGSKSAVSR